MYIWIYIYVCVCVTICKYINLNSAGSPAYAAPEKFIMGATVTFSADVWSLVITLFELVAGALPYKAIPDAISASAVIAVGPRPPSWIFRKIDSRDLLI